jgi:hypothetical protein
MSAVFFFILIAVAAVLASIAIRDHRRAVAMRRRMLDPCLGVLDDEEWSAGADGFPALAGRAYGLRVKVALVPDTMVVRRLPQLWLSVTLLEDRPGAPSLSLLTRYTGNEFYAITPDLPVRIEPPADLPLDMLVRGDGAVAEALCLSLAPVLKSILGDACVKEIAMTAKGVRIVRQIAEGERGDHLLLRQAVFTDAVVDRATLVRTLSQAAGLLQRHTANWGARAA